MVTRSLGGAEARIASFVGLCQTAVDDIDDHKGSRSLNTLELAVTRLPQALTFAEQIVARRQFAYCIDQIAKRSAPACEEDLLRNLLEFMLGSRMEAPTLRSECLSVIRQVAGAIDSQPLVVDARVETAMAALQQRYSDPRLSLVDVAQEAHVSPWHLSRLLSRHAGQGFVRCLAGVRIAAAKRLLSDTALSIKEIAASAGFSSTTQLDRHFKRAHDTTPVAYRRDQLAHRHGRQGLRQNDGTLRSV